MASPCFFQGGWAPPLGGGQPSPPCPPRTIPKQTSDHVLLANAQEFIISVLKQADIPDELVPAWEAFYHRYDPLVRRFARVCGIEEKDLDDATQSAWAVIIPTFPEFECASRKGSFRAWLFTRVRSNSLAMIRHEGANPVRTNGFEFAEMSGASPEPCVIWEQRWNEKVFAEALNVLKLSIGKLNYKLFVVRHLHYASVYDLSNETGLERIEFELTDDELEAMKAIVKELEDVRANDLPRDDRCCLPA